MRKDRKDEQLKSGAVVHWSKMTRRRAKDGKWRYYVMVTCPDCGKTRKLDAGKAGHKDFTGRCHPCAASACSYKDEKLPDGGTIMWSRRHKQRGRWYVPVICPECGRERVVTASAARQSSVCRECYTSGGSRYKNNAGYIMVSVSKDDPYYVMSSRGAIPEHRLIMARHLGRPLSREEVVHHINGKRDDNRIENLELCVKGRKPHPPGQRVKDSTGRTNWGAVADFVAELFTSCRN